LAKVERIDRAVLFGSRAMGTFGKASDIDLALEGKNLDMTDLAHLSGEFAESSLPYEIDLVLRAEIVNPELESRIEKHGIMFYERCR
jgi:predicted nucleotidyltransferase